MKSENIRGFRHFPFNLYENPLPSQRYRKFLDDPNYTGRDKHSIPNELEDRLEQAVRIVYHIMHDFDRLERSKVYEVINAKSMHHILDSSIKYYDFRTSELVRLLFETAILYLKKSDQFENQKEIIDDMSKPLSKFFQMLSHSLLQHESLDQNLNKEEQEQIKKYLDKHDQKRNYDEYKMLEKRNDHLYKEIIERDIYQRIISNEVPSANIFDFMPVIHESLKEVIDEISRNKDRMVHLEDESFNLDNQTWRLSNAYNHLEPYICRIKPLNEFQYLLDRTVYDPRYISDINKEFVHVQTKTEFDNMMYEKYKNKRSGKNIKCLRIHNKNNQGAAEIPLDIYHEEMRKFFEQKGLDLEYNNKENREQRAKKYIKNRKYLPRWILDDTN